MSILGKKRFMSLPPWTTRTLYVDVIVAGEGAFFSRDILERLERGIAFSEIPGAISIPTASDFMRRLDTLDQEDTSDFDQARRSVLSFEIGEV